VPWSDEQGLVPLPPHCAKQSRSHGFAGNIQGPPIDSAIRCASGPPTTCQSGQTCRTASDWMPEGCVASPSTKGVGQRCCALLFCTRRLPFVGWLLVTRVETTSPKKEGKVWVRLLPVAVAALRAERECWRN